MVGRLRSRRSPKRRSGSAPPLARSRSGAWLPRLGILGAREVGGASLVIGPVSRSECPRPHALRYVARNQNGP